MKILLNNNDLNTALKNVKKLGFVPTMGSIHRGHISLIKKCKRENNKVIVSIFVNPKQFNNKKDFLTYPKNIKMDLLILKKIKVDFLYLPKINDVYEKPKRSKIKIHNKDKILCAKYRKGHFEGVLEVMDILTKSIRPKKIYMGEKDYQQLYLVKNFIEKKYKSKIIPCKTIRNKNKLALSSRNIHLNKKNLNIAEKISQNLISFKKNLIKKQNYTYHINQKKNELSALYKIKIEYLELRNQKNLKQTIKIKNSKLFLCYYLNKVRLIDNF